MTLKLKETNIKYYIHIIGLKIPIGGRNTSWQFANMTKELNQETTPAQRSEGDLNLRPLAPKPLAQTVIEYIF